VLLQMQHRTLVKSLHSERLNPHIAFEQTPFVVQQENAAWERPRVDLGDGEREYPRIAGISSFGAGGSNAHLIVEEYIEADRNAGDAEALPGPSVVVLSARSEDRLQEQVRQLLAALREPDETQTQLAGAGGAEGLGLSRGGGARRLCDVAYTLQVGREAMEWRLACVVEDVPQLCARLEAWLGGDKAVEDLYQGQARQHKEALGLFAGDDDLQEAIAKWIERGKLNKLAELWAKGLSLDWGRLYADERQPRPRRIPLPTYPFAKERYWVESKAVEPLVRGGSHAGAISGREDVHKKQSAFLTRMVHDVENGRLSVDAAYRAVLRGKV
jgi:acyl transferase domain-containing protein